jgi:hypothetical protein
MEGAELKDDHVLTQYGTVGQGFRNKPRDADRGAVSLILGKVTAAVAAHVVRVREDHDPVGDVVRFTTVGTLRARGFTPLHTPNRRNTLHVSVACGEDWDEDAFDRSFDGAQ